MIYIYKLVDKNGDISPEQVDVWDGKFENSTEKMSRKEVIKRYNNGYYFTSEVISDKVDKFEIPDELLEAIDIDPKKLSPQQVKAMFAKLKEKGLLNDKPGDKKSGDKGSSGKESEGAQGNRAGLVKKKVTVHRGGKTFEQERWVKPGEDEAGDKPKKGEEEAGDKPGKEPEPKKPKGPAIKGLNKPDEKEDESGDIKGREFMDWQPGEDIPGGVKIGSKVDVGKFGVHTVKDIAGGVIIGEDDKHYSITSIEEVLDVGDETTKDKKSEDKKAKDKKVEDKKPEAKESKDTKDIKDKKPKDKKSKDTGKAKVEKFEMSKDNLKVSASGEEIGLPASTHSGGIHLCEFTGGEKSIYKVSGRLNDIVGEVGFYGLSQALGWDICPQTEAVNLGKGKGTSQAFVEGKEPLFCDVSESKDCIKVEEKHFSDLAEIFVMDTIIGNPDRHFQNVKINEDGKCWAIDNDMWGENTYIQNHPERASDVLENLQTKAGEGKNTHYDSFTDWLDYSLDEDGYKKFKGIVNEKMGEILAYKDKIASHYVYEGEQYRMDIIDTYIDVAEKYMSSEQKK